MRLKNVLYFLALALFIVSLSNTAHATAGIVVYSNASAARSVPQYRIWNGTDFGAGLSTGVTTGTIAWLKVVTAPTRYEAVMGSLDSSGDIIFAVYSDKTGNWSNVINVSRVGFANANRSSFDIAYENVNGRALVIYTNGTLAGNNASIYRIWNGTAWSAPSRTLLDSCVGQPSWIRAEPRPNATNPNQIITVDYNITTGDICGQVWNGTAWTGNVTLTLAGEVTTPKRIFDIAAETLRGDMMVAFAKDANTTAGYIKWNGTNWGQRNLFIPASGLTLAASIQWIDMKSDIDSNRIVYSGVDGGGDLDVWHWNGSTWGTGNELDISLETFAFKDIASGFWNGTGLANESDGVVLYGTGTAGDSDFGYADCTTNTTCQAGTWTVKASATNCGGNVNWLNMFQDPKNSSNAMSVTVSQATANNVCIRQFNNSRLHNTAPIGTASVNYEGAFFSFFNYVTGSLNVSLQSPVPLSSTGAFQNITFDVNVSVFCSGLTCGTVNGTVRRNSTAGGSPDTRIPNATGTPFFTISGENQTCGAMTGGSSCLLTWKVNATGILGTVWVLDVNFTSDNTDVISNDTANFNITIISMEVTETLLPSSVSSGGNVTVYGRVNLTNGTDVANNAITISINGIELNASNLVNDSVHSPRWWNYTWKYRKRLNITNSNASIDMMAGNYTIEANFNSGSLVDSGKMLGNGSDLRVVWFNATSSSWLEIDRINRTSFNATLEPIDMQKYSKNPVLGPGPSYDSQNLKDPTLFKDDNGYWYMAYSAANGSVWSTALANATNFYGPWNKMGQIIVPSLPWEGNATAAPYLMKNGSKYIIYYSGGNFTEVGNLNDFRLQIGIAETTDITNINSWVKYSGNPVIPLGATYDSYDAYDAAIFYNGSMYYMYYSCYSGTLPLKLCLANSTDLYNWTKDPLNPIYSTTSSGNGMEATHVLNYSDTYIMLATEWIGSGSVSAGNQIISKLYSRDMYNWTHYENNPLINYIDSPEWEEAVGGPRNVGSPGVWLEGETLYIAYQGYNKTRYQIGLATAQIARKNVTVNFMPKKNITASSYDDNYYIYYGNPSSPSPPENRSNVYIFKEDFNGTGVDTSIWNVTSRPGTGGSVSASVDGKLLTAKITGGTANWDDSLDSNDNQYVLRSHRNFSTRFSVSSWMDLKNFTNGGALDLGATALIIAQNGTEYVKLEYDTGDYLGDPYISFGKVDANVWTMIGNFSWEGFRGFHEFKLSYDNGNVTACMDDNCSFTLLKTMNPRKVGTYTRVYDTGDIINASFDDVMVNNYVFPEHNVSVGYEEYFTKTNSTGGYNYTFTAPSSAGDYTVTVNVTYQGVFRNNTATLSVSAGAATISFTLYIPATNETGTASSGTTQQIIFNSTNPNGIKINATAHGGLGGQQTATVSIFRYNNTGNVAMNITLNFTTALPTGVTIKSGWADSAYQSPTCTAKNLTGLTACANVSGTTTLTRVANLSTLGPGMARDVWLWTDYSGLSVGFDQYRNLSSVSVQG